MLHSWPGQKANSKALITWPAIRHMSTDSAKRKDLRSEMVTLTPFRECERRGFVTDYGASPHLRANFTFSANKGVLEVSLSSRRLFGWCNRSGKRGPTRTGWVAQKRKRLSSRWTIRWVFLVTRSAYDLEARGFWRSSSEGADSDMFWCTWQLSCTRSNKINAYFQTADQNNYKILDLVEKRVVMIWKKVIRKLYCC